MGDVGECRRSFCRVELPDLLCANKILEAMLTEVVESPILTEVVGDEEMDRIGDEYLSAVAHG
jgi:hypothetical protein